MRRSSACREDRQEPGIAIHSYRRAGVKSQHEATVAKTLAQQSQYGWGKRFWLKSCAKKLPCTMMCDGVLTSNIEKWCQSLTAFFADLYLTPTMRTCMMCFLKGCISTGPPRSVSETSLKCLVA